MSDGCISFSSIMYFKIWKYSWTANPFSAALASAPPSSSSPAQKLDIGPKSDNFIPQVE
jgi:hypothetical protein